MPLLKGIRQSGFGSKFLILTMLWLTVLCFAELRRVGAQEEQPYAVYVTQPQEDPNGIDPNGRILKLEDLSGSRFSPIISDLNRPHNIVCGPDGNLYFNEVLGASNRIWRADQNGNGKTIVAEWATDDLRPGAMVFAPNGDDLYFGTVSVNKGQLTRGLWVIPSATSPGEQFNRPQQVISGEVFHPARAGNNDAVEPYAFLTRGPFAGHLLIVDNPSYFGDTVVGSWIVHTSGPSYSPIEEFKASSEKTPFFPSGIAINSHGEVLITDSIKGKILEFTSNGRFKNVFADLERANQIAIGPDDTVYVTNASFNNKGIRQGGLFVYEPDGSLRGSIDTGSFLRGVTICAKPKLTLSGPTIPGMQGSGSYWLPLTIAIIGALATILASVLGALIGKREGERKGGKHNVLKFLDAYQANLDKAIKTLYEGNLEDSYSIAKAIVENVHTWRDIQRSLGKLLNGLVDELGDSVKSKDPEKYRQALKTLCAAFEGERLAVEAELEKQDH